MSDDLPFYSEHAREMEGSTAAKIRAILAQGALEWVNLTPDLPYSGYYLCKPILQHNGKPYNKTTYTLKPKDPKYGGHTSCSCQGFQIRWAEFIEKPGGARWPNCSHVAALSEHWARKPRESMQMTLAMEAH